MNKLLIVIIAVIAIFPLTSFAVSRYQDTFIISNIGAYTAQFTVPNVIQISHINDEAVSSWMGYVNGYTFDQVEANALIEMKVTIPEGSLIKLIMCPYNSTATKVNKSKCRTHLFKPQTLACSREILWKSKGILANPRISTSVGCAMRR